MHHSHNRRLAVRFHPTRAPSSARSSVAPSTSGDEYIEEHHNTRAANIPAITVGERSEVSTAMKESAVVVDMHLREFTDYLFPCFSTDRTGRQTQTDTKSARTHCAWPSERVVKALPVH